MGDGRGVRTVAELNEVGRLIAVPNGQVRGKDQTEPEAPPRQGDGPERETTNRPVRVTAARTTSLRARPVDGSTQTVRTPMCTGPQRRPTKSADGSVAERLLVTVSASRSMPSLDPERPPHGSARRARGTPPEVAQHLLGGGAPGDHRQEAAPSTAGALPYVGPRRALFEANSHLPSAHLRLLLGPFPLAPAWEEESSERERDRGAQRRRRATAAAGICRPMQPDHLFGRHGAVL